MGNYTRLKKVLDTKERIETPYEEGPKYRKFYLDTEIEIFYYDLNKYFAFYRHKERKYYE